MNCPEAQELLQRYLDGETLSDPSALHLHLEACAECRERFAAAKRMRDALRSVPESAVSPAWTERTVTHILTDRRRRLARQRWLAGAALAASMLLMIGGYLWLRLAEPVTLAQRTQPPAPVDDSPVLTRSVQEARSELAALTDRIADQITEQTQLLPAATVLPLEMAPVSWMPLERPLSSLAQSLRQSKRGVSAGLDPVANSARRALTFFLRPAGSKAE